MKTLLLVAFSASIIAAVLGWREVLGYPFLMAVNFAVLLGLLPILKIGEGVLASRVITNRGWNICIGVLALYVVAFGLSLAYWNTQGMAGFLAIVLALGFFAALVNTCEVRAWRNEFGSIAMILVVTTIFFVLMSGGKVIALKLF
jgi:hypothetical protein